MKEKISLLMSETGCDRGEAELALEMCGYEVEKAVSQIPHLLRDICALKGKFVLPDSNQHGLILIVLNMRSRNVLRTRAILSYDPAVYDIDLEEDWFSFEKHLYGCRLWDGSLPAETLEVEQRLLSFLRSAPSSTYDQLREGEATSITDQLNDVLKAHFRKNDLSLRVKKDILDLGQFQSLRKAPAPALSREKQGPPPEDLLLLKINFDEDPNGMAAAQIHAGDLLSARIIDHRDIAQYLAKIFGGLSPQGNAPIEVPVEAIESVPGGVLIRARFAVGVAGDEIVPSDRRLKLIIGSGRRNSEDGSWWRRFFKS